MAIALVIISACLISGVVAAVAARHPALLPEIGDTLNTVRKPDLKHFSPKKTLFIIGPSANHPACKLQRRLIKPALAALIREDVTVLELYGQDTPRRNGELMKWLDPALLRHAMNADRGFFIIFVDADGKTVFRREAPMVTADILAPLALGTGARMQTSAKKSDVLQKLSAA
ncbi:MAG: hypothetical protein AAGJ87_07760 [Pseudomonadota bacterium]